MLGGWADKKVACGPFLAVLRTHLRARGPPPPLPRRGPPSHSEETPPLGTGEKALLTPLQTNGDAGRPAAPLQIEVKGHLNANIMA